MNEGDFNRLTQMYNLKCVDENPVITESILIHANCYSALTASSNTGERSISKKLVRILERSHFICARGFFGIFKVLAVLQSCNIHLLKGDICRIQ